MQKAISIAILSLTIVAAGGCSKKQLIPGILAGAGSAAIVGGIAYRISLPEADNEGAFGRQPEQKAGVAVLLFTGAALVLSGIIWSATTPVCESDADCWTGDTCERSTMTCVPRPRAPVPTKDEGATAFLSDRYRLDRPAGIPPRFALRLTTEGADTL